MNSGEISLSTKKRIAFLLICIALFQLLATSYILYYIYKSTYIACSKYSYTLATTVLIRHLSYYISCLHFQNKNLNFSKLLFSVSDCFLHLGIAASPVCIERHSYFLPKRILKTFF